MRVVGVVALFLLGACGSQDVSDEWRAELGATMDRLDAIALEAGTRVDDRHAGDGDTVIGHYETRMYVIDNEMSREDTLLAFVDAFSGSGWSLAATLGPAECAEGPSEVGCSADEVDALEFSRAGRSSLVYLAQYPEVDVTLLFDA